MPHMGLPILRPGELRFPEAETPGIRIESWSNSARLLHVRGFTRDGILSFEHTTNADRSRKAETFTLPDWPQFITVYPDTAPVRRGECYVRLTLLAAGAPVGILSAGYLTDSKTITWPPGTFEGFLEGRGRVYVFLGDNPAAGNEISLTVPTNARWRILMIKLRLVTDATVIDRRVRIVIQNENGVTTFAANAGATQPENSDYYYYFGPHLPYLTSPVRYTISYPMPTLELPQGYIIKTSTENLQAGDNYYRPWIWVEEWIEE